MSDVGYHKHIVEQDQEGMRLDALVGSLDAVVSRSSAERLIEDGYVTVDGDVLPKKYRVVQGEVIGIDVVPPVASDVKPEFIPLDIRFEDEYMIVLSKQPDLVVHPATGNWTGTLVNGLLAHCMQLGSLQGDERPGIVHRLDKDTSGLMMAAKTDTAQVRLQEDIKIRKIDRRYLALVHGWIAPDTGLIDAPIGRNQHDRLRMGISEHPSAKQAVTTFTVLERFEAGRFDDGFTLLECHLYTGRTHQIRVHMEYIHHPIVGDQTYGARRVKASHGLDRQFLHSYSLKLQHPITGEEMAFLDPLPQDLQAVIDDIADHSCGRTAEGAVILGELERCERKEDYGY
ncbi:MAG: RluA family pseudouridine synthase [Coriobacteriia bacterium]|nr:RluA family pseudouridine synthase [Coriobacteriia bacterium]